MGDVYQYILSVSVAAMICAIIKSLTGKDSGYSAVVSLLCGVFIAATIISPLLDLQLPDLGVHISDVAEDAEEITALSSNTSNNELREIIKEQTEAYVLDKAASLNTKVSVDITLAEEEPIPVSAVITGDIAPYNKSVLSQYLEDTIGIPEVAQIWK